jgi:hypothetical protein
MSFKSMGGRPATKWSAWLITACLSALSGSAYATAEHRYGPGEYDLIDHGLAPDQQYAIVAQAIARVIPNIFASFWWMHAHTATSVR